MIQYRTIEQAIKRGGWQELPEEIEISEPVWQELLRNGFVADPHIFPGKEKELFRASINCLPGKRLVVYSLDTDFFN